MPLACESPNSPKFDWAELDLYRFFAFVFASPSHERFETLAQPFFKNALAELWRRLGGKAKAPHFVWFKNYEEYEATYIALFDVGIPEPPVPLFESAHDKTRPAQEIALENTWFHDALGLKWDSTCAVPDYLITQLEFLAVARYTLEHAQEAAAKQNLARLERDFLERHLLNWVPTAVAKLNSLSHSAFGSFLSLLGVFLRDRFDEVRNAGQSAFSVQSIQPGSL